MPQPLSINSPETMYTNEEMANMHYMYGLADGNCMKALRLYQERFPTRKCPDRKTFQRIHQYLRDKGRFAPQKIPKRRRSEAANGYFLPDDAAEIVTQNL